jgi:hypothetical protein
MYAIPKGRDAVAPKSGGDPAAAPYRGVGDRVTRAARGSTQLAGGGAAAQRLPAFLPAKSASISSSIRGAAAARKSGA